MFSVLTLLFLFCVQMHLCIVPPLAVRQLLGVWKSGLTSDCSSFCIISMPSHDNNSLGVNDVHTFLEFDQLFETFIFKLVGNSPIVLTGAFGVEQRAWVVEYKQSIKDHLGNLQHEELGTFVFVDDDARTIYRNAVIPHGVTMRAKGNLLGGFPFKPIIEVLDASPKNVNGPDELMEPFKQNFKNCKIPISNPNLALFQNNLEKNITNTFVYSFPTAKHLSLPFLDEQFGSTTIIATFWVNTINTDGKKTFELQYTEQLSFVFGRLTEPVDQPEDEIAWMHVITSTLQKVESPPECDDLSKPVAQLFTPLVGAPVVATPRSVEPKPPTPTPKSGAPVGSSVQICTYTEQDWGAKCSAPNCENTTHAFGNPATNAACMSSCSFKKVFGSTNPSILGLILGLVRESEYKWISLSTPELLTNYLNTQSGTPDSFEETFINPRFRSSLSAGMFGPVLASAKMNLAFSLFNGFNATNTLRFARCSSIDSVFAGYLVKDVIAWANMVITSQVDDLPQSLLAGTNMAKRYTLLNQALSVFNQAFRQCQHNTALTSCFQI